MILTRQQHLEKLQSDHFDLIVIGGGATGTGIALDGTLRGLSVALVDANDFAAGTSSRSTKLIHGGLRYLEQAIKRFDWKQYSLVQENLKERHTILKLAPHLTRSLPILIPIYRWFDLFYFWPGVKLYDWLAGEKKLGKSHFVSAKEVIKRLPKVRQKHLKGGLVLYEGQFDDSRMNLILALTAVSKGAIVANHVECVDVRKNDGKIDGIIVKDKLTEQSWEIKGDIVVNATGPLADEIRHMDDSSLEPVIRPSAGTHLLLDGGYTPANTGLLIPKTSDGRLMFALPWEGSTLVGTTDVLTNVTDTPQPTEGEIDYLLDHLNEALETPITHSAIKAAWTGIRPLIHRSHIPSTAKLPRDYCIEVSDSGLYSIMGGKWSSYRKMAQDFVDVLPVKRGECVTESTLLIGGEGYTADLPKQLQKEFSIPSDIAHHLARAYGDRARVVAEIGKWERLAKGFPYIQAEVIYAVQYEYACTPEDILQRRTHLAFLDQSAAESALPVVTDLMRNLS